MRLRISAWALLAANAIPVFGCLFFDWPPGLILALYWIESGIVGLYTWAKLLTLPSAPAPARVFAAVFFTVHFGGFMFVHGVFVSLLVFADDGGHIVGPEAVPRIPEVVFGSSVGWGLLALLVSHGISYVQNFWLEGERQRLVIGQVMIAPYARIFTMHLTLILGAFALVLLGSSSGVVALLVGLKTYVDWRAHERERRSATAASQPVAAN